jgi:hypothetical protein
MEEAESSLRLRHSIALSAVQKNMKQLYYG